MLKVLRDNLKALSWILWLTIATFIVAIFVDFGRGVRGPGAPDSVAATVGEQTITLEEFQQAFRNMEANLRQVYGNQLNNEMIKQLQLPLQALDGLVNQKILLAEAESMGLQVSDEELRAQIVKIPALQDENGEFVGADLYLDTLRRNRLNPESFENDLRQQILLTKLQDILRQNLYVTAQEVEDAYRRQVERAKVRFIQLDGRQAEDEVEVSDNEVQTYFDDHPEDYQLPERRSVAYLLVDTGRIRQALQIDESVLYKYYEDHPDEFSRPEQVQARHILLKTDERSTDEARRLLEAVQRRIEGGEDFAAVAREVSEDPGSAPQGGDLGFFGRGAMTPEFEKAAFDAQINELVGPVETPFGLHLLQVTARREGGQRSFAEVRPQIQARLAGEQAPGDAEAKAKELAQRLEDEAPVSEEKLSALATDDSSLIFETPEAFSRTDFVTGLGRTPAFMDAVFGLEDGGLTEPVQVPRGWVIAYLKETLPPRQQALEEVEAQVRQAVEAGKRKELAMTKLRQARIEVDGGRPLEDVAKELGLAVQESEEFGPGGRIPQLGFNSPVVKEALSLDTGAMGGPVETTSGAVLFQVAARTHMDPAQLEAQREQTRSQLETRKLNSLLASLLQERRRDLAVTYNQNVLDSFEIDSGQLNS